jgi:crotonobetainyl-CoA:carnitine CoA-transferase CaiB-like acyl-CoA transferase
MLAAFGAEVVKVERPPGGDWARRTAPLLPEVSDPESSALFLYLNSGKKSVVLDWQSSEGSASLERLLQDADVLVEDTGSSAMNRFGLGIDRLQRTNRGLVVASITDFGDSGPYSSWSSTPLVNLALGGFFYLSGDEGREPLMLPGFQADYLAGLYSYIGVTMALWARSETGEGQHVEVSAVESLASLHQFTTVMETYSGVVRRRHGNRWESDGDYARYPITLLPCKDGHESFAVSMVSQWEGLCVMIGRPDLLERPEFATFADRRSHAGEIDEILTRWLADKTKADVVSLAAGTYSVPAAPASNLADVLNDGQYSGRGLWVTLDHPVAGKVTQPTVPFTMSETYAGGEHGP